MKYAEYARLRAAQRELRHMLVAHRPAGISKLISPGTCR